MLYGYDVDTGFIGWVEQYGRFMKFASYRDYVDYLEEDPK